MAAELVGGAVLSAFLQVAFARLASRDILHYFQKRRLNETLVKKLKIMLLSINSIIDDAEYKQFSDSNVKAWLLELKDAVYDAEDVLDELNYHLHKQNMGAVAQTQSQAGVFGKVRKFFTASATCSFDENIESRMKQVLENLEFLESRKIDLGLKQGIGGPVGFTTTKLPTTSLVDEVIGIYGRDVDKDIIIEQLLKDSHFSVMSIVGMGGLGKTTLAQLVYNDPRIKSEFDLRVWMCVSDDFDVLRLTKTIYSKINSSNDGAEDLDELQNKLKDALSGKKLLIVLDDVWCDDYILWEALRAPFSRVVAGSRILVTSRNESVALAARSDEIYHPHRLSDEDSWLLFINSAFDSRYPQTNFDFEEIGRRIVNKCNGLPLALKSIGSLLYKKSSWEEWNNVLTSELWNIPYNNVLPSLILSYHYLPSHLKRCFAYCSLFPKDYEFDKEELILLWMAQDFLQASQQNKSLVEVGKEYFQELVSRSFFQKAHKYGSRFIMHDILNDLAIVVSGGFCFKQEVEEVQQISEKTRHFSFLTHELEEFRQFKSLQGVRKLRTFLHLSLRLYLVSWTSSELLVDQLSTCKCLRVLTIASNVKIMEIPDTISNLIHLRYLDLSKCKVKRLPESICLLHNLQTLKLANCENLDELPSSLHKLKNLCYLDLKNTKLKKIPPNLGEVKHLQLRLTPFHVGKCSELNIKQLGKLNVLGELTICELQNIVDKMDAMKATLKEKDCLEELNLLWNVKNNNNDSQNDREVLEKLQPHPNLKKLWISHFGGTRFPAWFGDNRVLSNIVSLRLERCKYCLVLPSLGLLPSLKSLSIEGFDGIVAIGAEFLGSDSCGVAFASLETLQLIEMENWEEWDCTNALRAFPCLKVLRIILCSKLRKNLPQQLPSLQNLVIEDCPQLVAFVPWAPRIQRLALGNCDKVQLEYTPSTLKGLYFHGPCMNGSLLEKMELANNNNCLEEVKIHDCLNWEFPLKKHLGSLRVIEIERSCGSLRNFTLDLFPALQVLSFEECNNLEMISVSEGCNHVPSSLASLCISDCPKFISLPEHFNTFAQSLCHLVMKNCPAMESFPEGGLPSKLKELHIMKCPKLFATRMKWGLHNCGFLFSLFLTDDDVVECLPEPGLLPTSLTLLWINRCSNLKMLDYEGLCLLPSLERLHLLNCQKLKCLPKEGLPTSLSVLAVEGDCQELKQRCQKLKGEDWPKIAHIPRVYIQK